MILLLPRSTLFPYTTLFRSFARFHHQARKHCLKGTKERIMRVLTFIGVLLMVLGIFALGFQSITYFTDRKSTRLNSSHRCISYAVFCLKKKNKRQKEIKRKT